MTPRFKVSLDCTTWDGEKEERVWHEVETTLTADEIAERLWAWLGFKFVHSLKVELVEEDNG